MNICLINLPRYEIHRPPLSLAILSAICNQEQINHECIDLSLLIWQKLPEKFNDIDNFCITKIISDETRFELQRLIDQTIQEVLQKIQTHYLH